MPKNKENQVDYEEEINQDEAEQKELDQEEFDQEENGWEELEWDKSLEIEFKQYQSNLKKHPPKKHGYQDILKEEVLDPKVNLHDKTESDMLQATLGCIDFDLNGIEKTMSSIRSLWQDEFEWSDAEKSAYELANCLTAVETLWRDKVGIHDIDETVGTALYNDNRKKLKKYIPDDNENEMSFGYRAALSHSAEAVMIKEAEDIYLSEKAFSVKAMTAVINGADCLAYSEYGSEKCKKAVSTANDDTDFMELMKTIKEDAVRNSKEVYDYMLSINGNMEMVSEWGKIRKMAGVYRKIDDEDFDAMKLSEAEKREFKGNVRGIASLMNIYYDRMLLLASDLGKTTPIEAIENVDIDKVSELLISVNKSGRKLVSEVSLDNNNSIHDCFKRIQAAKDNNILGQLKASLNFEDENEATFVTPDGKVIECSEAVKELRKGKPVYATSAADGEGKLQYVTLADKNGNILVGKEQIQNEELQEPRVSSKPGFFARAFDRILKGIGLESLRSAKCIAYEQELAEQHILLDRNERIKAAKEAVKKATPPEAAVQAAESLKAERSKARAERLGYEEARARELAEARRLEDPYQKKLSEAAKIAAQKADELKNTVISNNPNPSEVEKEVTVKYAAQVVSVEMIKKLVECEKLGSAGAESMANNPIKKIFLETDNPADAFEKLTDTLTQNKKFSEAVLKMPIEEIKSLCDENSASKNNLLDIMKGGFGPMKGGAIAPEQGLQSNISNPKMKIPEIGAISRVNS